MSAPRDHAPARVWLLGPMAVGKTTIGTAVAARRDWAYVDNDAELLRHSGQPLAEWVLGPELHEAEAVVVTRLAALPAPFVAGIPASVADAPALLDLLAATGRCVLLTAPVALLSARAAGTGRPLGADAAATLREQLARRQRAYTRVAELVLDTSRVPVRQTVDALCRWLDAPEGVGEPGAATTDQV